MMRTTLVAILALCVLGAAADDRPGRVTAPFPDYLAYRAQTHLTALEELRRGNTENAISALETTLWDDLLRLRAAAQTEGLSEDDAEYVGSTRERLSAYLSVYPPNFEHMPKGKWWDMLPGDPWLPPRLQLRESLETEMSAFDPKTARPKNLKLLERLRASKG